MVVITHLGCQQFFSEERSNNCTSPHGAFISLVIMTSSELMMGDVVFGMSDVLVIPCQWKTMWVEQRWG
jgi:hypothetical protein